MKPLKYFTRQSETKGVAYKESSLFKKQYKQKYPSLTILTYLTL